MPLHSYRNGTLVPVGAPAAEVPQLKRETACVRGCCVSQEVQLDLGKYEMTALSEIARGAESIVYRGTLWGGYVAVKKPRLSSAEDINRFHHELQLLSKLRHPNIATLKAARAHPPDYAFVFEYYERGNLSDALHVKEWKPSQHDILSIAFQIASALQYIHGQGVVHRDVKPANVLLDNIGKAHLADFGLAVYVNSLEKHTASNWQGTGKPTGGFHKKNMVGTLQYMAPEVLKKEVHSDKSDVFSFAITVNELATGVFPYSDRTTDAQAHTVLEMNYGEQQLAAAITSSGLRPVLPEEGGNVHPSLSALLERCWHEDPLQRPSMTEVVQQLSCMLEECLRDVEEVPAVDTFCSEMVGAREILFEEEGIATRGRFDWANIAELHSSGEQKLTDVFHSDAYSGYLPTLSYGAFATSGAREKMEDRHFMAGKLGEFEHVHAFGVFDGHRGFEAAEYAASSVPQRLLSCLSSMGPGEALSSAFRSTDEAFRRELDVQRVLRKGGGVEWHPGCTAATALLLRDRLLVANAGDCRTVLCRKGQAVPLSRDHTAADPQERERVMNAGGSVAWRVNTWRVGKAAIEVTRSLGDGDLKPAVTAEPEVLEHTLTADDEFMVMASDGLWEKMTNDEMIAFVYDTVKEPSMCGKRLATEAVNRGSRDNITVLVIYLTPVSTVERVY